MQLTKQLHFPTQIYFSELPDAENQNAILKRHIYRWREQDPEGVTRSNAKEMSAWHSRIDLQTEKITHTLLGHLFNLVQELFNDLGYHPSYQPACDTMWVNISGKNGYNRRHTHPNVLWSGVYYVQCPEDCGDIYFSDPRAQNQSLVPVFRDDVARKAETWNEIFFHPKEGRILIFPAWLAHEVRPNLTLLSGAEADRISFSFNFFQLHKKQPRPNDATLLLADFQN